MVISKNLGTKDALSTANYSYLAKIARGKKTALFRDKGIKSKTLSRKEIQHTSQNYLISSDFVGQASSLEDS